ncbi:hypothetical protein M2192_002642 [Bradyrhizobium elkanii USDA 61]|nr:hypothetical protein [Bradyrhizobium elkanii]MCS4005682.1 hypothetical protein [Bradyrhizobium elkanii USDA 61]MCP1930988.1 hypothetical protein [Bradyrhizobium elkanii]MCS3480794.1 hypothetical protein [Bradyrhizobium elkanii]MCS3517602.1 hypothetical protein [Bradyrhizobium elkanii]
MIARPSQRQIGQHHVLVGQLVEPRGVGCSIDAASRRQHDALGRAGRSRGVEDDSDVRTVAGPNGFIDPFAKRWVGCKRGAAVIDDIADCDQSTAIVAVDSARFVVDNPVELRQSVGHRQDLVDLLLVLRCDHRRLGVSENKSKLISHSIGVDRNGDCAQRLRCHHGPVKLGPIGADYRNCLARPQAKAMQAGGVATYDLGNLSPGPALPDAKILMPERWPRAKLCRVSQQQFGKRVIRSAAGHVGLDPKTEALVRSCYGDACSIFG